MSRRMILIYELAFALLLFILPSFFQSQPIQNLTSGNVTAQSIAEVTKMPAWYFVVGLFVIALIGFTYLWMEASKRENTDDIPAIKKDLEKIKIHLGIKDDEPLQDDKVEPNGEASTKCK